jgi:hypothetical protein
MYLIVLWKALPDNLLSVGTGLFIHQNTVCQGIHKHGFQHDHKTSGTSTLPCIKYQETKKGTAPQNWLLLLLGYHPSACSNIHLWINSSGIHVTDMYLFQRDTVTKLSVSSDRSQGEVLFHNQWMCNLTSTVIKNTLPLLLYDIKKRAQDLYLIYKSDQLGVYRTLLYFLIKSWYFDSI